LVGISKKRFQKDESDYSKRAFSGEIPKITETGSLAMLFFAKIPTRREISLERQQGEYSVASCMRKGGSENFEYLRYSRAKIRNCSRR